MALGTALLFRQFGRAQWHEDKLDLIINDEGRRQVGKMN
jgi:hypothetical protein